MIAGGAAGIFRITGFRIRGRSSAGRAPALQAGGHRFDPGRLHHQEPVRAQPEQNAPVERFEAPDPPEGRFSFVILATSRSRHPIDRWLILFLLLCDL